MKNKNNIKNIITSLILQFATIVCAFITTQLIIQTYGSNTNGLLNSIKQFLAYIALLESGFGPVVKSILYKPIAHKNQSEIESILKTSEKFFRKIALIFIPYIILLCILFPILVDNHFDWIYTVSLILVMAISTFSEYFFGMTYKLFLQAKQKTYIISIIQASTLLLSTIVMIILMNIGCSIQIVELFGALIFICRPIIQNLYVKHKYSLLRNSKTTPCKIEQQWNGLIQHIASVIHNNTDIVILTLFTTLSEVSVYSVYLLIITGVKNIVQAFNNGIDASFGHLIAIKNFKKLNEHFSKYELFYHTITTIIFICTLTLITPFVNLYTNGITDADYNRPLFAFLITLAEFIWAIRLPYSSTALAAGHFKQTQTGAIFEALINIVLSIILVFHFGIIGVTIGTLVSMFIRTIEFMYHNSKYILKRPTWKSYSWLPLIAAETTISLTIINLINLPKATNYLDWIQNAIIVTLISSFFTITTNLLVHHSVIQKIIRHHK